MTDTERSLDPVASRATSAMGRGIRPGLSKAWSVSSPNMAAIGALAGLDTEVDILERIRDLEEQITAQQVVIHLFKSVVNFYT